ncbi:MAG: methyl-accepting chemotaxis protein [Cellvibrionaceae bacterium]
MKLDGQFFRGRYWQPGLILGTLVFLVLTVYFGYLIWQNSRSDIENIQRLRELQASSANAVFFAQKSVTGDAAALDPFSTSIEVMDNTVNELQQSGGFTGEALSAEYEKSINLWRSIKDNSDVLTEVEYAINLVNAVNERVNAAAATAEKLTLESVEVLSAENAPRAQLTGVSRQSILLRQMADNLSRFIQEEKSNRQGFDNYQANLRAFEANYAVLMNGDVNNRLRPITNARVRVNTEQVSNLVDGIRKADTYVLSAVERLLLARDAQQRIASNFEDLQFSLGNMSSAIQRESSDRFPSLIHVIMTALGLLACVVALIFYQKVVSKQELEKEQEEGQRTQGAILRLLDELVDLADGDLTISATVSEDFTGAIADSINFTIDQLRQLVSRINSTAVEVSHAAQGTQQTALHLAEASDHQAQEIAGASAAINEMAVTIDQVSANASESALVAGKSVSIANNGAKLVQNTIHGMDTIREQIQDTSKRIKRLGESSQEIGDIVSLINDIADQTNILALNAAIQASMAGDAGRGFAVVADEVQRLAERSAAATKQIETIVKTIQTDTNEAVISMEQTTSEVVTGARLAQDAGVALEEIEGVSANLAELIQNISNAARQQASSAGHISNTMNVIQEITSQTSSGTNATAESIGELANMALELRESVAGFTLPPEMVADLEQQEIASAAEPAMPPTLDDSIDLGAASDDGSMDDLLSELEVSEEDMEQAGDFFELLAGDGGDDDDLLSEFDVDLSDIEFPEDGKTAS